MSTQRIRSFVTVGAVTAALFVGAMPAQAAPEWIANLHLGPPLENGIRGLVVDAAGNTYVTATTGPSSNSDVVTAAWSPTGVLLWSHVWNGPANWHDQARGLVLAPNGMLWVTGNTPGPGSYANVLLLQYDAATGALQNIVQHSGGAFLSEAGAAVATDAAGNVYVAGSSSADGLVLKFDANGVLQWRRTWDGPAFGPFSQDHAKKVVVAPDGNPVVLIHGVMGNNQPDYVVVKYAASNGASLWQTNWGVPGGDYPQDLEIDAAGDVFASGIGIDAGSNKYATIKLRGSDGLLLWQAYDNAGFHIAMRALALDAAGGVYVTGSIDPDGDESNHNDDFFTVKRDAATGALRWTHGYGANCLGCLDLPADLVVDAGGTVWVGGTTNSPPYDGEMIVLALDATTGLETGRNTMAPAPNHSVGVALLGLDAGQNLLVGAQARHDNTFDIDVPVVKYAARASVRSTGTGCSGTGTQPLVASAAGLPTIPNPGFLFQLTGGPPALLRAFGLGLRLLPVPAPLGSGGCSVQLDLSVLIDVALAPGGTLPLPIPPTASLRGVTFSTQGLVFDAGDGAIVTSNALTVMIGQ